jgi:hypothetical protein
MSEWFSIDVESSNSVPLFTYEDRRIPRVGEILSIKLHHYRVERIRTILVLQIVDRYDKVHQSADSIINRAGEYIVTVTELNNETMDAI